MAQQKLHDIIRNRRKELGMTQEKLGEELGVDHSHVNKWEKGRHKPSEKYVEKLATALDLNEEELKSVLAREKGQEYIAQSKKDDEEESTDHLSSLRDQLTSAIDHLRKYPYSESLQADILQELRQALDETIQALREGEEK